MFAPDHALRVRRLYKLIFRVHRALPPELRIIGDEYARDEFKRHKKCNPEEAKIFLNEWTVHEINAKLNRVKPAGPFVDIRFMDEDYAINVAKQMKPLNQAKRKEVGKYLGPEMLDHMTDEQLMQLYELHKAAFNEDESHKDTNSNKE